MRIRRSTSYAMLLSRTLFVLVVVAATVPAAAARAHTVSPTITPPASPPAEDSAVPIVFAGNVTSLNSSDGYLHAEIRPAGGTPCAPTPRDDPGTSVGGADSTFVEGIFSLTGSYVAPAPGNYLVCAWIEDFSEFGPVASAIVSVRPAVLQVAAAAPPNAQRGVPFAVTVNYRAEVPRYLTVLVVRASSCSISSQALRGISSSTVEVADYQRVSGAGSLTGTARFDAAGTYLVCGFLEEDSYSSEAAQYAVHAATVVVASPVATSRSCGYVGGRRNIRNVRARNISCPSAKALARRWASRRRAPRQLGSYRCFARSGNVTCTAGSRQVRFRFGRR